MKKSVGDTVGRIRSSDYDDIRDTIIDRTASVFARKGFAATSVTDIAEACECSRSRLYHYFDSKEAILHEMLTAHIDLILQRCRNLQHKSSDPKRRFLEIVKTILEIYAVSRDRHVVLLTCLDVLPPEHRQEVVSKQRELIAFVRDILQELGPGSSSKISVNADTMLFFGMINWTYTWHNPEGAISPEQLAERAVKLFLDGYVD